MSGVNDHLISTEDNESPYVTRTEKWEDNYKRGTFYVEKKTMEKLNMAAGREKGKKTEIINKALQNFLKKNYPHI